MYYIRFLKAPALHPATKAGSAATIKFTISVTTDLGDATYPHDMPIRVSAASAARPAQTLAETSAQWTAYSHALGVQLSVRDAAGSSVVVRVEDARRGGGGADGALLLPHARPVLGARREVGSGAGAARGTR